MWSETTEEDLKPTKPLWSIPTIDCTSHRPDAIFVAIDPASGGLNSRTAIVSGYAHRGGSETHRGGSETYPDFHFVITGTDFEVVDSDQRQMEIVSKHIESLRSVSNYEKSKIEIVVFNNCGGILASHLSRMSKSWENCNVVKDQGKPGIWRTGDYARWWRVIASGLLVGRSVAYGNAWFTNAKEGAGFVTSNLEAQLNRMRMIHFKPKSLEPFSGDDSLSVTFEALSAYALEASLCQF